MIYTIEFVIGLSVFPLISILLIIRSFQLDHDSERDSDD